jgi:dienelactone hydrolase
VRDAGVFLNFLGAQKEVTSNSPVGLTGYCMGGGMVAVRSAMSLVVDGANFGSPSQGWRFNSQTSSAPTFE